MSKELEDILVATQTQLDNRRARVNELQRRIVEELAFHNPVQTWHLNGNGHPVYEYEACEDCDFTPWPCRTFKILSGSVDTEQPVT